MGRISARIGGIAESATLAVTAKANALKAAGEDVIGFGAGEPDFPTPEHIVDAARRACGDKRYHHYTPAAGLPELREVVAHKTERDSGFEVKPEQVVITNGAKQALYNTFATLLDPGDEVIVQTPYWVTYPESIKLAAGNPVFVPTDESTGFRAPLERLEAARTPRTKVVLFVSPSNPTGAVYPPTDVEAVGRWAAEHGLWVVTDEIYEQLVYGDARFSSMPGLVQELTDRCVVVNGVSKTYAMTGWRVGWLVAPSEVAKAAASLQSHATSNVSNVAQAAALAALTGGLEAFEEMKLHFDRRRRTIHEHLSAIDGVTCIEPEGAFYAFPSVADHIGRDIRGRTVHNGIELAEAVLEEAKVAFVPGEAFGAPGYARLSYALDDDSLIEGVTRIAKLLSE